MQEILIGIDVGTSALKAIAVGADTGEVVASSSREYPLYTEKPRWAEQDGEDFARAANEALTEIASMLGPRSSDVRAIGLTGQMHSAMCGAFRKRWTTRTLLRSRYSCRSGASSPLEPNLLSTHS